MTECVSKCVARQRDYPWKNRILQIQDGIKRPEYHIVVIILNIQVIILMIFTPHLYSLLTDKVIWIIDYIQNKSWYCWWNWCSIDRWIQHHSVISDIITSLVDISCPPWWHLMDYTYLGIAHNLTENDGLLEIWCLFTALSGALTVGPVRCMACGKRQLQDITCHCIFLLNATWCRNSSGQVRVWIETPLINLFIPLVTKTKCLDLLTRIHLMLNTILLTID